MIQVKTSRLALSPAVSGAAFYGVHFVAFGAVMPFMNVYFGQMGLNGRQIGMLGALMPIMTLLVAPFVAAYADRVQRRVAILAGCSLVTVFIFVFFRYADEFVWLLLVMLAFALVRSPVLPLADGLIARMARRNQLNYGAMRLWGSIGFATAAIIGGAVWQRVGYLPMFLVGSLLFLPTAWLAGTLQEGQPRTAVTAASPSVWVLFQDRGFVVLLLATFFVGIGMGMGITYEGIYMDRLGGSGLLIGLLLGIGAYSEIPIMLFSDRIRAKLGGIPSLLLAYGLFALAYWGYSGATAVWVPLIFAVAKGMGVGLYLTTTIRVVDERVPEEWAATAQSLVTASMMGVAILIASLAGGMVMDVWGVTAVFRVGSFSVMLAMLLVVLARWRGVLSLP
ncbi:MAG: MFS transporter [Ardenticatenaceae bacterium]|nr:MFS transporter [Ardenticatenaceae bacterium]